MKSETLNLMNHLFDLDSTITQEQRRAAIDILSNSAPSRNVKDVSGAVECFDRIKELLKNYVNKPKYLRKKEAANYLRCSTRKIDRWREFGDLPYYRLSRRLITLKVEDLDELAEKRRIDCRE